jgi:hypothetical protein
MGKILTILIISLISLNLFSQELINLPASFPKKGDSIRWDNLKNKGISCETIKTEDVIDCVVLNSYGICLIDDSMNSEAKKQCDEFLAKLKKDINIICEISINSEIEKNKLVSYFGFSYAEDYERYKKLIKETFCNKLNLDVEGSIKFTPQILQNLSKNREIIFTYGKFLFDGEIVLYPKASKDLESAQIYYTIDFARFFCKHCEIGLPNFPFINIPQISVIYNEKNGLYKIYGIYFWG